MIKKKLILVILCCIPLIILVLGVLFYQTHSTSQAKQKVNHTYNVLLKSKELQVLFTEILSAQRAYLVTKDQKFLDEYGKLKSDAFEKVIQLATLTKDSGIDFSSAIKKVNKLLISYCDLLEERAKTVSDLDTFSRNPLSDTAEVENQYEKLTSSLGGILFKQNQLLSVELDEAEINQEQHYYFLTGGLTASLVVMLIFFALVLRGTEREERSELSNQKIQQRLAIAMQSTADGIFDWNLENDDRFFSPRFKEMLGYQDHELQNSAQAFDEIIHPDDKEKFWEYTNQYLAGQLNEYSYTYRLKYNGEGWIWVHSRARALFDKRGKPIRLIGANTDVTDLKENEERLKKAKQRAVQANQEKSMFLANMSHEIRTPLNSIIGASRILMEDPSLKAEQKKLVKISNSSSQHLLDLINDVLDLAQIEGGELKLKAETFSPAELCQQVISIMSVKAQEKEIDFECHFSKVANYTLIGDPLRLRQIVINIVGNAVKFTEKGKVEVLIDYDEQKNLIVEVRDTGIGISKDKIDSIFNRFEQEDDTTTRDFEGSGLGLAITQKLVTLMEGDIKVESEKGKGSVFTIRVPLVLVDRDLKLVGASVANSDMTQIQTQSKILVVEDYEANIVIIKFLIDKLGIEFDVAKNGLEAVEKYQQNPYKLILMDIQMPKMDGLTATKHIRAYETEKKLLKSTIVAMTAHALAGDQDVCYEAGMDDYITKPIMEPELVRILKKHLTKAA